ncbi:MAG: lanthionine synthetase LanC family protein, partial [Frankia sp.]
MPTTDREPPTVPTSLEARAEVAGRAAFAWLSTVAHPAPGGLRWFDQDGAACDDLYAGTAGVLLACAEAWAGGGVPGDLAAGARNRLLYLAGRVADEGDDPDDHADPRAALDNGLFTGWAGLAVALGAWSEVAADRVARDAADRVLEAVAARVLRADDPGRPYDIIAGDAGILLALLGPLAREPGRPAEHEDDDRAAFGRVADPASSALVEPGSLIREAAHASVDRLIAGAEPAKPTGPAETPGPPGPAESPGPTGDVE